MNKTALQFEHYPVYFGQQDWMSAINWQAYAKVALISDSNVGPRYAQKLMDSLPIDAHFFQMPAGEFYKTRDTKHALEDQLLAQGFGRDTLIIALGGGVVLDLVGFLAATYCRGVAVVYMPTSVMAMVDASMGGKTGINTSYGKNMLGVFSQPHLIWMQIAFLQSLPEYEFINGLAEVIKHAVTLDGQYYQWLNSHCDAILQKDPDVLLEMIYQSILIKQKIVAQDEKEVGMREILNFGHTVGHAIELCSAFKMAHGHAVALGMLIEAYMSHLLGHLAYEHVNSLLQILKAFQLPLNTQYLDDMDALKQAIRRDKKSKQGLAHLVMLKEIGQVHHQEMHFSFPLPIDILENAVQWVKTKC